MGFGEGGTVVRVGDWDLLCIVHDLKRTVAAMLRDVIPRRQIVEETSALYGTRRSAWKR